MGDRGRVVHVRVSGGAASLKAAGVSYTELAANRRWTSLAPVDGDDFDGAAFAAAVGADVVQVWFDDDAGVMLQVDGADGFSGQLTVEFFEAGGAGVEDRRFIDAIVRRTRRRSSPLQRPHAIRRPHVVRRHLPPKATGPCRCRAAIACPRTRARR